MLRRLVLVEARTSPFAESRDSGGCPGKAESADATRRLGARSDRGFAKPATGGEYDFATADHEHVIRSAGSRKHLRRIRHRRPGTIERGIRRHGWRCSRSGGRLETLSLQDPAGGVESEAAPDRTLSAAIGLADVVRSHGFARTISVDAALD